METLSGGFCAPRAPFAVDLAQREGRSYAAKCCARVHVSLYYFGGALDANRRHPFVV